MLSLKIDDLAVSFPGLSAPVLVLDGLEIAAGSRVALTGGSGSGKSTLINIIAGLERVQAGRVVWGEENIADLPEGRRDRWRAANIGLVMQEFHLFPGLSALDNILLPARLSRAANADLMKRAESLFATVGLKRPGQHVETMSRGEMQRVAIARALLRSPGVIIADEPTASLDLESGEAVGDLLLSVAASTGSTLIVASHDQHLIGRLDRRLTLSGGRIVADTERKEIAA
ncbi:MULTISPECIES: ABC transporter ATP-binding protein [Agrobacterium]|jgi:putative ABC transport system ATP-binding protein|uniref:ABC transport system ATP-binding protein n=2 Tax=Agrobacterium tumefaciens complex TaxID=1183400 RepID=A0AAP5DG53_AGRTU|nr:MULTISPECIES: ATP-binding cassette domain-containing protein [Agrobacterium]MCP2136421.1 putative ABC transport system ATP-binding protein [Rhizobium sp. SLBN-94]EPR08532.1 ABC transporter ATP-binding protein [Agrobacterium radiobacter DSM 30147]KAB0454789.1 ATP-binding cassette domain-containing protein [Agrobacterium tumefaciens]KWT78584.1 ABC transporter [Agrobacterium radiobacter]MBB4409275.1 putative ABC transport system ATP-binding protein [Agrobacterium radiobacter]